MSHAKNKVEWCLKKAKRELEESGKHRGLARISPNREEANRCIAKAEHNLRATIHLKSTEFSDWCAPTAFYSIYQALLALLAKFGYESSNQECTFALIYSLIEDEKIRLRREVIDKITELNPTKHEKSKTITNIRELYQYGTKLSIEDNTYDELLDFVKKIIADVKVILEE